MTTATWTSETSLRLQGRSGTLDSLWGELANVPKIHPDESAYSWYYRLSLLNGSPGPIRLSQRLFDSRFSALAHDFPDRISIMIEALRLPIDSALAFARQHTIAGYFLPFLNPRRVALIHDYMRDGQPKDLKMRIGLPASRVTSLHPLKFCQSCAATDLDSLGYAYWRIDHQLPSSWICIEHNQLLASADLKKSPRHYRKWHSPEEVPKTRLRARSSGKSNAVLKKLAEFSSKIRTLPASSLDPETLSRMYRRALENQGFATRAGVIRLRELIPHLQNTYQVCRPLPGFHILDGISDDWAGFVGIARRQSKPAHPFKHLLLIALLFEDWAGFIEALDQDDDPQTELDTRITEEPDSRPEVLQHLVTDLGLSISAAGRQVGVSATTATQWAAKLGLCYTSHGRPLDEDLLGACRAMLQKGLSRQVIADQLPISTTSLTRLLAREPELRNDWQEATFQKRRDKNRSAFTALLRANPGVPVKALRRIPGNGYMWLYRNDREWLMEHLPMLPPTR